MNIGITERGDAGLDFSWTKYKGPKILITKAPQNLFNIFGDLKFDLRDCIIHCSITGLGGTLWEPHVSPIDETLYAYNKLVEELGGNKVILRIDPIIIGVSDKNIIQLVESARGRLRISFLDMYDHVRARLTQQKIEIPVAHTTFHADIVLRKKWFSVIEDIYKKIYPNGEVEVCGEPGLKCTGCVSEKDLIALNITDSISTTLKQQRLSCQCLAEKTELLYNKRPCAHNCIYCYWKDKL